MKKESFEYMKKSVSMEIETLKAFYESIDEEEFGKAVEALKKSTLTVTSACGSSSFAADKFAHALCCIEMPAKFVAPSNAVHGGMGAMKEGNALVLVSRGGKTDELIAMAEIAKVKKAVVITVTSKPESPLGKLSDIILEIPDLPESDRYGVMSTTSFVSTMSVFNALMVALMEENDYKLSDFALIHPGGAVGKRIN